MMMTMVNPGHEDLAKQRMLQAQALRQEVRGGRLNLGKKVSTPRDVMMEELNLDKNRGSRMFQERQRRVEKFTVENTTSNQVFPEAIPPPQQYIPIPEPQRGRENQVISIPAGKHSLVINLQKSVAKKGSPQVLAPGYSGPLKYIPHEKFNMTVIPKLYCSPWKEALGDHEERVISQLPEPPQRLPPENYRCFNRSALPFGGPMASKRVIPVVNLEAPQAQNHPSKTEDHFYQRPSFNRKPKGWGNAY